MVSLDYLNVLTNPVTKNKLKECNYVEVKKSNGKYEYNFIDNKEECSSDEYVVSYRELGSPSIKVSPDRNPDYNGWYNNALEITATADTLNNGPIVKIGKCNDDTCNDFEDLSDNKNTYTDKMTYSSDIGETQTYYMAINSSGKKAIASITAKVDKTPPTVKINPSGSSNQNRTFTLTSTDTNTYPNQSGISKTEYKINNGTYKTYSSKVTALTNTGVAKVTARTYDKAGNVSDEVSKELVCNKDKVKVEQSDDTGCNFSLKLSLPDGPTGVSSNEYEYVVWNKNKTTDTDNYKSSASAAQSNCSNIPTDSKIPITSNETNKISMEKNTKYMYYCFAVRPVRSNRSNLTGIGNYYRGELVQPTSEKTVSNTGWTVQYKHAKVANACK